MAFVTGMVFMNPVVSVAFPTSFRFDLFNRSVDLFRGQAIVKRRIDEKSVVVSVVLRPMAFCLMYSVSNYLYQGWKASC